MHLKHLSDKTLHQDLILLAKEERSITLKVLFHLKEVERRKLFCDFGYSSLFDYCVQALKYSESSAVRRIHSARLLEDLPEIAKQVESGQLNLVSLTHAGQFFKREEINKVEEKRKIIKQISGLSAKQAENKLKDLGKKQNNPKSFTLEISTETMEKIKQLKLTYGDLSFDQLINLALTESLKKREEIKPTKVIESPNKRVPTLSLKKAIKARDKVCVNCGSQSRLQIDHIKPWSLGGKTTMHNLRLLCFNCNDRARIRANLGHSRPPLRAKTD